MLVYVNKETHRVLNLDAWNELVKDYAKDMQEDEEALTDYLDCHYTTGEIFHLTDTQKNKIGKDFLEHCLEESEATLLNTFWIETEVICRYVDEYDEDDIDDDDDDVDDEDDINEDEN